MAGTEGRIPGATLRGPVVREPHLPEDQTMLNPFENPMTTKLHASLHAQAEKALSLSRKALDF